MKHLLEKLQALVPYVAIDKIIGIDVGSHIVVLKNVTITDRSMDRQSIGQHLPHSALMDGHIQSGLLYVIHDNHLDARRFQLGQVTAFSSSQPVFPGDQLRIETYVTDTTEDEVQYESTGYVDGVVCSHMRFSVRCSNAATSGTFIHPTASVHASVILGQGVHIGPYCIVNEGVQIGDGTHLRAHVMVDKWCQIGKNNHLEYGAVVGSPPQDIKYHGEFSYVIMGDNNQIREYVTINRATGPQEATRIGSNNMLLTNTHIGHNCTIGNHVVMANVVHLGGHTVIQDNVTIGGLTGVHQFVRIGKGAMIGGYSRITQDVPPFMLCDGNPASVRNINLVGCRRQGVSREAIAELKQVFKLLYRSHFNIRQALAECVLESPSPQAAQLLAFIEEDTSRGISKKQAVESADE